MKMSLLKLAILGTLGQTMNVYAAPGFVGLPITGFASSAYTNCFNDGKSAADPRGNFGSYSPYLLPTTTMNNTCWVVKPAAELVSPIAGYTLVGSRTVNIPRATGDSSATIGTLVDYVWRNSSANMCIIGTRVTMIGIDHDNTLAGTQYFQANDLVRGGFSGLEVNAGYALFTQSGFPVFRVGRTFTSVQHRALSYVTAWDRAQDGVNYLNLPTKTSVTVNITGENFPISSTAIASTTLATQDAMVNDNWVDFTMEVTSVDADTSAGAVSPFTYIQAPCATSPTVKTGAIRLRQTAQENTTFKEIIMDGYAIGTP